MTTGRINQVAGDLLTDPGLSEAASKSAFPFDRKSSLTVAW